MDVWGHLTVKFMRWFFYDCSRCSIDYPSDLLHCLVVGLPLDPSSGVFSEQEAAGLVVNPDQQGEWDSDEPPRGIHWSQTKTVVETRCVLEEGGKGCLKEQTEVEEPVGHSLLEDRQLSGLGNDDISPLDDNDGDEEGCVAGQLKIFALDVGPLLSIGILDCIVFVIVPISTETNQVSWKESILSHDDKVGEESSRSLDHTNHTIGQGDQTLVHQFVRLWVTGHTLHDVRFSLLISEGNGRDKISTKIDTQDGDGTQWQGD